MKAHRITSDLPAAERDDTLAYVHPASPESVATVLAADTTSGDGRSGWVWLRLPNGDLILGVFPQGATYEEVERDAAIPADL